MDDRVEAAPVNLQLPKIKFSSQGKAAAAAVVVPAEPRIRFAEKTTTTGLASLGIKREPGESEFKKRKIGEEGKKNLRTRGSDD